MTISSKLHAIQKDITATAIKCGRDPAAVQLVAVSKRHSIASINEAMEAGQLIFGENYIQEAVDKRLKISPDATFHFIGHIQSNKAKQAAQHFSMVETVDRYKLAKALNNHLIKLGRSQDILIQVNIGEDPKKSGCAPEKTTALLEQIATLKQIRPVGLMTIPPFTEDIEKSRIYFRKLRRLANELAEKALFINNSKVELSMGMSRDYMVAIEEGATIIRIGTAIFGERPDKN